LIDKELIALNYIPAKHILHRSKNTQWFGTDHTMNLYRGCCHGCIYCDSRSDCYGIQSFDSVCAKQDALRILRDDLQRKVRPAFICTGSMSDPYNPYERELELTRHALELVDAYECGVAISTKSDLIVRDRDILTSIATHSPVMCKITVTTTDGDLAKKIEPAAPSPQQRLSALRTLSEAGLFTGVLLMPTLPFLTDGEDGICAVVDAAADAGARFVYAGLGVTLRQGQREHFLRELDRAFPGRALSQLYLNTYGTRYSCAAPHAKRLWQVFARRCQERGLLYQMNHINSAVQRPYTDRQLKFFDL